LQILLEYTEWRNFKGVIRKAKAVCENAGNAIGDHFVDVNKMIKIGHSTDNAKQSFEFGAVGGTPFAVIYLQFQLYEKNRTVE
jgi:hypothetical protein